jgi:hypothetical protein
MVCGIERVDGCDRGRRSVGRPVDVTDGGGRTATRAGDARRRLRSPVVGRLGRRQEPLEVAQAVAAIATGVDPEVTEPPGVAPGPDRVRVHAKQPRGLGDRKGGVDGS